MNTKIPREGTKSLAILIFIGSAQTGRRTVEIERFIVESLMHRMWDPKRRSGSWVSSLYGFGRRPGLFKRFCTRFEKRWYLTPYAADQIRKICSPSAKIYARSSATSITEFNEGLIKDLSIQNAEKLPNLGIPGRYAQNPFGKPVAPIIDIAPAFRSDRLSLIAKSAGQSVDQLRADIAHNAKATLLPKDVVEALVDLRKSRSEVENLQLEFDRISEKLVEAKAKQAQAEDNTLKVLGL